MIEKVCSQYSCTPFSLFSILVIRGKYVKQNDEEGGAPVYLKKRSRTHNVCSVIFRSIEGDKAFWQISKCGFVSNGKKWDEHGWKDISFKKQVFILKR